MAPLAGRMDPSPRREPGSPPIFVTILVPTGRPLLQVDYRSIRNALPEGRTLPEELWTRRHKGILVVLWVLAGLIPVFALARGVSVAHTIPEAAIGPVLALLATTTALTRRQRSVAATLGLLSCSAVLVHLSGGVIEMHFHFFVMVAVVALYQDWVCFLVAIAYVLVHHGDPRSGGPQLGLQPLRGAEPPLEMGGHPRLLHRRHQHRLPGHVAAGREPARPGAGGGGAPARGDADRRDAQRRGSHGRRGARPPNRRPAGHRGRHRPHGGVLRRLLLQRRRRRG